MPVVVTGLTDEQLTGFEIRAEAAMLEALQVVADTVADTIAQIQVASAAPATVRQVWAGCPYGLHDSHPGPCPTGGGGVAVLVAADPPPVPDIPGPPGQPYVSPDDLAAMTPLWNQQVQQTLMPVVAEVYQFSGSTVHAQLVDAARVPFLPPVSTIAAEQYLQQAAATFATVGNTLAENARNSLLDGFKQGDSIPELAARVRGSAQMTAPTAVMYARTEVLDASNAGSYNTAKASGLALRKGWFATPDPRTRPSHVTAGVMYGRDEQFIPLADQFQVGGYPCDRPHDPALPPAERSRCRCTIGYSVGAQAAAPIRRQEVPPLPGEAGEQAARNAARIAEIEAQGAADVERVFAEVDEAARRAGIPPVPGGPSPMGRAVPGVPGSYAGLPRFTVVRPELRTARTRDELAVAMRTEMRRITDKEVVVEVPPDASMASMREFYEGVLLSAEQFPDTRLRAISWFTRDVDPHYAEADDQVLSVNAWWFSQARRPTLLARVRKDAADWDVGAPGWMPRNAGSVDALGRHEYGHVVHLSLGTETRTVSSRALSIVQRHATAEQVTPDTLTVRQLGAYASKDEMELVAGAYTDVTINGDTAAVMSREIVDELAAAYRRTGGAPGNVPVTPAGRALPEPDQPTFDREALAAADSTEAVSRVLAVEYRRLTGREMTVDLRGSVETAREHAEGVLRSVERFPETDIKIVRTGKVSGEFEFAEANLISREIVFSDFWSRNTRRDLYLKNLAADDRRPVVWHPKSTNDPAGIAAHETGHLWDTQGEFMVDDLDRLLTEAADRAGVTVDKLISASISDYANKNLQELVAEAFADVVITGDKASDLAKSVVRLVGGGDVPDVPRRAFAAAAEERDAYNLARYEPSDQFTRAGVDALAGSHTINDALREGREGLLKAARKEELDWIDRAFAEQTPLPRDILVRRGVRTDELSGVRLQVGAEWTDNGFVSTSAGPVAEMFTGPAGAEMRILVPAGSRVISNPRLLKFNDEVVLDRGQRFRVVADNGMRGGRRQLDVEVVPASRSAFAAPARSVAQLRKAVTDAGQTVPTGLRQAALRQFVQDLDSGMPPAAARQRAVVAIMDERRAVADALREADELVANGASARALAAVAARLRTTLDVDSLKTVRPLLDAMDAMDAGDPDAIRAAAVAVARAGKLKPVGAAQTVAPMDRTRMLTIGADDVPAGGAVRVIRPGYETTFEGQTTLLSRAAVVRSDVPLPTKAVAKKAVAPVKAVAPKPPAEGAAALAAPRVKLAEALQGRGGRLPDGVSRESVDAIENYLTVGAGSSRRVADARQIAAIDRVMEISPLDRPVVLWRGMRSGKGAFGPRDRWPRDMTGREFTDEHFASTSSSRTVARRFTTGSGGGLLLKVRVPEGVRAIQISGARQGRVGAVLSESEILLDRNVTYRVVRDLGFGPDELPGSPWSGLRVLEVEAIPSPARVAALAVKATKAAPRKAVTPREFEAKVTRAASGEDALTKAPVSLAGSTGPRKAALELYQSADSNLINFPLRGLDDEVLRARRAGQGVDLDRTVGVLDEAMAESRLLDDVVVYRGEGGIGAFGPRSDWPDSLAGREWVEPAYLSTSIERARVAGAFGDDRVVMRIVAPRGTGGVRLAGGDLEGELLLERGLRLRVVRDHGSQTIAARTRDVRVARLLDVEVVPSRVAATPVRAAKATKVAAPKPPPAPDRMTPAALRKELAPIIDAAPDQWRLTAADLATVPKPTLAAWTRRARELDPKFHAEEVGRWRQVIIDRQRAVAELLAEADELIANQASASAMGIRARGRLRRIEAQLAGWPGEASARAVVSAMATGNQATIRRAVAAAQRKLGLRQVGDNAGTTGRYDRAGMSPIGDTIPDGAPVIVVRPGYEIEIGGQRLVLSRPVVQEVPEFPSRLADTAGDIMDWMATPGPHAADEIRRRLGLVVEGRFAGIQARLDADFGASSQQLNLSGELFGPRGNRIGEFSMSVERLPNGSLSVDYGHVEIARQYRGSGFASEFNANLTDWGLRSGVREVHLTANIDVGAYAWARRGVDFASPAAADDFLELATNKIQRAMRRYARTGQAPNGLTIEQLRDLETYIADRAAGRAAAHAPEIADFGRLPGQSGKAAVWPGKWLMLGSDVNWDGVLYL